MSSVAQPRGIRLEGPAGADTAVQPWEECAGDSLHGMDECTCFGQTSSGEPNPRPLPYTGERVRSRVPAPVLRQTVHMGDESAWRAPGEPVLRIVHPPPTDSDNDLESDGVPPHPDPPPDPSPLPPGSDGVGTGVGGGGEP